MFLCKGGCGCIQRDRALQENTQQNLHLKIPIEVTTSFFAFLICVLSETQKEMLTCLLYYTLYGGWMCR